MSKRILIVDDEPNVRLSHRAVLEAEHYVVEEATSAPTGLEKLVAGRFDLAILDMRMPEMDGLDLLAKMRERGLVTPVVIITAYGDLPHAVRAVKLGAIDFLQKPLTPEQLRHIVEEIVARHETEPDNVDSRNYAYHLRAAKRAINHRDFEAAKRSLKNALHLDDRSAEGFNLAGAVAEHPATLQSRSATTNKPCGSTEASHPHSKTRNESTNSLSGERARNLSRSESGNVPQSHYQHIP